MIRITFSSHETDFVLKDKKRHAANLSKISISEETAIRSIRYIFCSDEFLLGLNQQFLKHDTYTDILTFTLSGEKDPIDAEIYISIDRVKENADKLKQDFHSELKRVMIHGILHLCGYNDHSPEEKLVMRAKENEYLGIK